MDVEQRQPRVPEHVERMKTEVMELGERLTKLGKFIGSNNHPFTALPHIDQRDLVEQLDAMCNYHRILSGRYLREIAKLTDGDRLI